MTSRPAPRSPPRVEGGEERLGVHRRTSSHVDEPPVSQRPELRGPHLGRRPASVGKGVDHRISPPEDLHGLLGAVDLGGHPLVGVGVPLGPDHLHPPGLGPPGDLLPPRSRGPAPPGCCPPVRNTWPASRCPRSPYRTDLPTRRVSASRRAKACSATAGALAPRPEVRRIPASARTSPRVVVTARGDRLYPAQAEREALIGPDETDQNLRAGDP